MRTQVLALVVVAVIAVVAAVVFMQMGRQETPPEVEEEGLPTAGPEEEAPAEVEVPTAEVESAPEAPAAAAVPKATEDPDTLVSSADSEQWRIYGTVMDVDTLSAVPDATVSVGATSTTTDDSGAYELVLTKVEGRSITCTAEGYARGAKGFPGEQPGDHRVDFSLQPGASVAGRVTSAATGEGIAGAQVLVTKPLQGLPGPDWERDRLDGTTDGEGYYHVVGVPLGNYVVRVNARQQGFLMQQEQAQALTITEPQTFGKVDFALQPGAQVSGRVINAQNQGVAGAKVLVQPTQNLETLMSGMQDGSFVEAMTQPLSADTDEQGRFAVPGLAYDTRYQASTRAEGYAPALSEPFQVAQAAAPKELVLTVTPGTRVSGIAVREDGSPAGEGDVQLIPRLASGLDMNQLIALQSKTLREKSAADGTFAFGNVAAGEYVASAGDTGITFNPFSPNDKGVVRVDGVTPVANLRVTVGQSTTEDPTAEGTIRGTVLSTTGQPVGGVRVTAEHQGLGFSVRDATTDAQGRFELANLTNGSYTLAATADEGFGEAKDIALGANVTIRLAASTLVSGVVTDDQGRPVQDARVTLEPVDAEAPQGLAAVMTQFSRGGGGAGTNVAGYFEIQNTRPGDYIAKAVGPQGGSGETSAFRVQAGTDITNLRISLQSGGEVSGTVEDAQGAPVQGAKVSLAAAMDGQQGGFMQALLPMMQQSAASTVTDESGAFTLTGVPAGDYMLSVTHSDYAPRTQPGISVHPGAGTTGQRVVLGAGGTIRGHYTQNGEPREGLTAQAMGEGGMRMAATDSDGRFELTQLAPGTYMVQVVDMSAVFGGGGQGLSMKPRTVEVAHGQVVELEWGAGQGASVSGTLSGVEEGAMTILTLRKEGSRSMQGIDPTSMSMQDMIEITASYAGQSSVGPDGAFSIDDVEPGKYILEVTVIHMDALNDPATAMSQMSPEPVIRQNVEVGAEPITLNLALPAG